MWECAMWCQDPWASGNSGVREGLSAPGSHSWMGATAAQINNRST